MSNLITPQWFDEVSVLGKLPPEELVERLRLAGEEEAASQIEELLELEATTLNSNTLFGLFRDKPWWHTSHAFGFLAAGEPTATPHPIKHAGNITPDLSLRNARIKITLDALRVAGYPGGGEHEVLFDFFARHQTEDNTHESLHFTLTGRVRDKQQMAVLGYPIFVGLKVSNEGVAFRCCTVNVRNKQDKTLLAVLESDTFKAGLKLVNTAQPALSPLAELAAGLAKTFAKRNDNQMVQDFYLGLDFNQTLTSGRLAQGSYIAVQIPQTFEANWNWDEWVFNPGNGQIVQKEDLTTLIPYNYVIFSVSKYED